MAHHRLGNTVEARRELDAALEMIQDRVPRPTEDAYTSTDRACCQQALREAEELINGARAAAAVGPQ